MAFQPELVGGSLMPRWLLKAEVESHLSLASGTKQVEFVHPAGTYRVILKNQDVVPGVATPLLTAFVIYEAQDIEVARDIGDDHLREFTETLALTTGLRARPHRDISLWDWSTAPGKHMGHVPRDFPHQGVPISAIDGSLMETVKTLLEKERVDPVSRALRWFANGVNGGPPDEQFEWFWLSVEVLAQHTKDATPVPDKCQRCHQPLYCSTCKETPTHKPYGGQAIQQLIQRYARDDAERLFEVSQAFRHALTHGEQLKAVEESRGVKIADVVDDLGEVARSALVELLVPVSDDRPEVELQLLSPSTFLKYQIQAKGIFFFTLPPGREPQLEDIPGVNIGLVRRPADPSSGGPSQAAGGSRSDD